MTYEIVTEQIKMTEKVETADVLKINAVYPQIVNADDLFSVEFNGLYETAARNFVRYAETTIKKAAESRYAEFKATFPDERFVPFGAVFKAKASQADSEVRVHIDISAYPGSAKQIVHVLDTRTIKFVKSHL